MIFDFANQQLEDPAKKSALLAFGLNMLANSRGQSLGQSIGNSGMAAVGAYDNYQKNDLLKRKEEQAMREAAQNNDIARQLHEAQMAQFKAQNAAAQRKQAAQEAFQQSLPEQDRPAFGVAPDEYIKNLPQFQAPKLEEVADPANPNRTIKTWLRPGQNVSQGIVAGQGKAPDWMSPDYVAAQKAIRAAGKTDINIDTKGEQARAVEDAKLVAKEMADRRQARSDALRSLPSLQRMEKIASSGNLTEGTWAEERNSVNKFFQSMGLPITPADKIANTEAYIADQAELLRNRLKAYGTGSGVSNLDLIAGGKTLPEISTSPGGKQLIIRAMKQDLQNLIDEGEAANYHYKHGGDMGDFTFIGKSIYDDEPKPPAGSKDNKGRRSTDRPNSSGWDAGKEQRYQEWKARQGK